MNKLQMRNSGILFLTAFIWGVAFVAQSVGMDYVGPFTFNCVRSLLGGLFLLPFIWGLGRLMPKREDQTGEQEKKNSKALWTGGILCGIFLCLATNFQQVGILETTVGKAGFITALYIVMVPLLGLFLKRKCPATVWVGVILALAGLYFLCMTEGFSVGKGEILVFIGAFLFSLHIMVIDYFSQIADAVKMSCIQFLVSGILSGILMILLEKPHMTEILSAWQPILYAGILSCGVGYTLQIVGQRGMSPTVASLILSLESVIAVLAGLVFLNQGLTARETLGCVLMSAAIILAQLPNHKGRESRIKI